MVDQTGDDGHDAKKAVTIGCMTAAGAGLAILATDKPANLPSQPEAGTRAEGCNITASEQYGVCIPDPGNAPARIVEAESIVEDAASSGADDVIGTIFSIIF